MLEHLHSLSLIALFTDLVLRYHLGHHGVSISISVLELILHGILHKTCCIKNHIDFNFTILVELLNATLRILEEIFNDHTTAKLHHVNILSNVVDQVVLESVHNFCWVINLMPWNAQKSELARDFLALAQVLSRLSILQC